MAAKQIFSRQQLASWDASARAWLQTADADRRYPQTQLMLIINNLSLPANAQKDTYESVLGAWISGMQALDHLVRGMPQQTQNGAVLLAIASWHLYPDMQVLAATTKDIKQNDELMEGALLTIPAHAESDGRGVFWSLTLSRMNYYSPSMKTERCLALDTSRVSMDEFWSIVLGAVLSSWGCSRVYLNRCAKFLITISNLVNRPSKTILWLEYLARAAEKCLEVNDSYREKAFKLVWLGMRRSSFLSDESRTHPPFFGLHRFEILFGLFGLIKQAESETDEQYDIEIPRHRRFIVIAPNSGFSVITSCQCTVPGVGDCAKCYLDSQAHMISSLGEDC